jgi:hypothetical protein
MKKLYYQIKNWWLLRKRLKQQRKKDPFIYK